MGCSCVIALMLSTKLNPQFSSSVSYLHADHRSDPLQLQPEDSVLSARMNASCAASSAACVSLNDSLGFRLDDRQHTFNPRPFFLNSLVRRIGFVLDRFNTDLNGSLVELRQLLHHEFESVKTFPSGEHSCCIRKRFFCSFARVLPSRCSAPRCDFCLRDSVSHRRLPRTSELGFFKLLMMLLLNEFGHDTGYFPIVNRRTQSSSRLRPPAIEHTVNLLNRSCLLLFNSNQSSNGSKLLR